MPHALPARGSGCVEGAFSVPIAHRTVIFPFTLLPHVQTHACSDTVLLPDWAMLHSGGKDRGGKRLPARMGGGGGRGGGGLRGGGRGKGRGRGKEVYGRDRYEGRVKEGVMKPGKGDRYQGSFGMDGGRTDRGGRGAGAGRDGGRGGGRSAGAQRGGGRGGFGARGGGRGRGRGGVVATQKRGRGELESDDEEETGWKGKFIDEGATDDEDDVSDGASFAGSDDDEDQSGEGIFSFMQRPFHCAAL